MDGSSKGRQVFSVSAAPLIFVELVLLIALIAGDGKIPVVAACLLALFLVALPIIWNAWRLAYRVEFEDRRVRCFDCRGRCYADFSLDDVLDIQDGTGVFSEWTIEVRTTQGWVIIGGFYEGKRRIKELLSSATNLRPWTR